jgi:hypothetical protein
MARVRVCRNCGWRGRHRAKDDYNRICPECTAVTHIEYDTTESHWWTFGIVGIAIVGPILLGLLACGLFAVMAILARRH